MKRVSTFFVFLSLSSLCALSFKRFNGNVLYQRQAAVGEGVITIRELQLHPLTMAGLLGVGDCIHRCEYVPHPGWPSTSAISFIGESHFLSKITIEWNDYDSAKVILDDHAIFFLVDGVWRMDVL
jgi:hypothetical protein